MTSGAGISRRTFGIVAAVIIIPLAYHASHAVTALEASRSTLRNLQATDGGPSARDEAGARDRLNRHLRRAALDHGVRLRIARSADDTRAVLVTSVEAAGSQPAVLAFADAVETGSHVTRFRKWRIARSGDDVRLTGEAVTLLRDWQ